MTYELLLGVNNKLTELSTKLEVWKSESARHTASDADHEGRIRSLESRLTILESSSKTSSGNWKEVWYVSLAALTLVVSVVTAIILATHH